MENQEHYELKLPVLRSITGKELKKPHNVPIETYIDEVNELCKSLMEDKEALIAAGLDARLTADLPVRLGALTIAHEKWKERRYSRNSFPPEWHHLSQFALKLKRGILQQFRFAFRHEPQLLKMLRPISNGDSHAKVIQDLNDLSVMGRRHTELLEAVRFEMSLLNEAARTSEDMSGQLSEVKGDRSQLSELRLLRDQAYTHLKEAVDEIRHFGRHVFQYDKKRVAKYRSHFLRQLKKRKPQRPRKQSEPPQKA